MIILNHLNKRNNRKFEIRLNKKKSFKIIDPEFGVVKVFIAVVKFEVCFDTFVELKAVDDIVFDDKEVIETDALVAEDMIELVMITDVELDVVVDVELVVVVDVELVVVVDVELDVVVDVELVVVVEVENSLKTRSVKG